MGKTWKSNPENPNYDKMMIQTKEFKNDIYIKF